MEKLAEGFVPGAFDVICSRGKAAYQHQGNRSFRATLEHHLASYANARSKQEKTEIVTMIYHGIQEATPEGGFIRKNEEGHWCRVPSHVAREKVSLLLAWFERVSAALVAHAHCHLLALNLQRQVGQG